MTLGPTHCRLDSGRDRVSQFPSLNNGYGLSSLDRFLRRNSTRHFKSLLCFGPGLFSVPLLYGAGVKVEGE